MKTYVNLYLAEVFLECEMFQTNTVEKITRTFYVQHFFYEYCARQATDELSVKYSADKMPFAWREIKEK
jgi:hypothetical protein